MASGGWVNFGGGFAFFAIMLGCEVGLVFYFLFIFYLHNNGVF